MALETGTYISDLVATNPVGASDTKASLDDHIRLIKALILATFPNISGAVTPTHTELNYVDGVTSAIQTQLDAKAPKASPAFTGTPTAPTAAAGSSGTQLATLDFVNNKAFESAANAYTYSSTAVSKTVAAGERCLVTAASVTIDLPAGPTEGAECSVMTDTGITDTVVDGNGANINGDATWTIDLADRSMTFVYIGSEWRII